MRLIKQLVTKTMELYDKNIISNTPNHWDFYQALNLVLVDLNIKINHNLRNLKYKKLMLEGHLNPDLKEKILIDFNRLVSKDRALINVFLKKHEKAEKEELFYGKMYKKGVLAVYDFEYEE